MGHPWNPPIAEAQQRRAAPQARIVGLREHALALERQAAADRRPSMRTAGTYAQMLTESGADDLEKRALVLRRMAAELEMDQR